jgi:DNA-binding FadR family transcriptional regulator
MIAPVKRQSLSETIALQLAELILSGQLEPGSKLSSEQKLAEQFGVSRNVVREGLRRLNSQGLVAVRAGDGVYIQMPDSTTVVNAFTRYFQLNRAENWLDELYQIREVLESAIARLAAQLATDEDIQALEESLQEMRANADDPKKWAKADWAFHEALARATQNSLFLIILEPLYAPILQVIEEGWYYPHGYESGLHGHGELLRYVRAHDAPGAEAAMLAHLKISYREVKAALQSRTD